MNKIRCFNLPLILFFAASIFCQQKTNTIEIAGKIIGLDSKWVYLGNTYPVGSKAIDSAQVTNNSFNFNFQPDTVYEPHLVHVFYKDKQNHRQILGIINSVDDQKGRSPDFIMETGKTILTGNLKTGPGITLQAGPQNEFYFKHTNLPYTGFNNTNAKGRQAKIDQFISYVREMPDAYYAIFALGNLKYQVDNDELKQMYNTFDDATKRTYSAKKIKEFLDFRPNVDDPRPNNILTAIDGQSAQMIDTAKKLNMIVFWASWCGPCRQEIPSLKKIASEIKDKRFRMVSVSIDKDKIAWKKAVTEEKMPWEQLSINPSIMSRMDAQYNLDAIPQIYLIDNKRNLVQHMTGFDSANEKIFKKTISDYLKTTN